jgi:hypothetical protein
MTPERLRAYVLILTRDIVPVALGSYLVLARGWPSELWHPPTLCALVGVTLLAPRNGKNGGNGGGEE